MCRCWCVIWCALLAAAVPVHLYSAEFDPKSSPSVGKALDKATEASAQNRKAYDEANQKALDEATDALSKEVERLSKAGKLEQAITVKKFAESMPKAVLRKAESAERARKPVVPKFAVAWNGHKYAAFRVPSRWSDAKKACDDVGGHLVIIETQEEQNALMEMMDRSGMGRDRFWIGATDEAQEGTWKWVDGSPLAYTNWDVGEPSNAMGGQHYAEMAGGNGGQWRDLPQDQTRWFICEWGDEADEFDNKSLPAVKRAVDKAIAEVSRNRKAYGEANEKALHESRETILKEVESLTKAGKLEEAVAVKKFAESFGEQVLAEAEKKVAPTPSPKPAQDGAEE